MTIAIGCDHAGVEYKQFLIKKLEKLGHKTINFGTDAPDSVDYPDFAHPVAKAVSSNKKVKFGILICGFEGGRHKRRVGKIACS